MVALYRHQLNLLDVCGGRMGEDGEVSAARWVRDNMKWHDQVSSQDETPGNRS